MMTSSHESVFASGDLGAQVGSSNESVAEHRARQKEQESRAVRENGPERRSGRNFVMNVNPSVEATRTALAVADKSETSLSLDEIWPARIANVLEVVASIDGTEEKKRRKRGRRNRSVPSPSDTKPKHNNMSADTLSTEAETPHGSELLDSIEITRIKRQTSDGDAEDLHHSNISFVSPKDVISALHSTSQLIGNTSMPQLTFVPKAPDLDGDDGDEEEEYEESIHTVPLNDTAAKVQAKPFQKTASPKPKKKKRTRKRPKSAEPSKSTPPKIRQRSLVFTDSEHDLNGTNHTTASDEPIQQRKNSIQDRLWSSYNSIYDSGDDDDLFQDVLTVNGVHTDGLHHLSLQALERMNTSMIDFSTSLDNSFHVLFPDFDVNDDDDDDSSSSYASSSPSEQEHEVDEEEVGSQIQSGELLPTGSGDVQKVNTGISSLSGNDEAKKRLLHSRIFDSTSKGATALHRMKTRIRSRRRRQIAILRTAAAHKKALRKAKELQETDNDAAPPSGEPANDQNETDIGDDVNEKEEKAIQEDGLGVSISSLASEVLQDFEPEVDFHGSGSLRSKREVEDDDTVITSNQKTISSDHHHDANVVLLKQIFNSGLVAKSEDEVEKVPQKRKARRRVRSPSPILHRLPPRTNTPSPTRTARKSHQRTSFGKYFPMIRSCPSSPVVEKVIEGERTRRVQFIGLSRPPNAGPMSADRWLLAREDSKRELKESDHAVSGDMMAPQRRKSSDGFVENRLQDSMHISRSSASSSYEAPIIPQRKDSLETLRIIEGNEYEGESFHNPAVKPKRRTLEDIIGNGVGEKQQQRNLDPLLAEALENLSRKAALAFETDANDSDLESFALETKQSSGEDSKESSNGSGGRSFTAMRPTRVDSMGSDSLDLAPYKPPIPSESEILNEVLNASIPDDIGVLPDNESVSTHSTSTRFARKMAESTLLSPQVDKGIIPDESATEEFLSLKQNFLGALDKHIQTTKTNDRSEEATGKSRASSDGQSGNRLPPSGRRGRTSIVSPKGDSPRKSTPRKRASSLSDKQSSRRRSAIVASSQERSRSHDRARRNTQSPPKSRRPADQPKQQRSRSHDRISTKIPSKAHASNRSQSLSSRSRTMSKPRDSSMDKPHRPRKGSVDKKSSQTESPGSASPSARPKRSSSKSKTATSTRGSSPDKSKSPSRSRTSNIVTGRQRRSGSNSHSPSRSSRSSRRSEASKARRARRPENESVLSPKISRNDVAAALSRSSGSRKGIPASCPQPSRESEKIRELLAGMTSPLPLDT